GGGGRARAIAARREFVLGLGVVLGMAAAGCAARDQAPAPPGENGERMRYLALGDSYTIGESVTEDARWPVQLAARLANAGVAAGISRAIDRFNQAGRAEAATAGVHWVDVTPASRRAASEPDLIASDGLHPSHAMYAAWVELVLPAAQEAMRSRRR